MARPKENKHTMGNTSPEEKANFISRVLFCWLNRLIFVGFKRPLAKTDLWDLAKANQASELVPKVRKEWQKQLDNKSSKDVHPNNSSKEDGTSHMLEVDYAPKITKTNPSLIRTLTKVFLGSFVLGAFLRIFETVLLFVQPELLRLLIQYSEDKKNPDGTWKGYVYALAMFLAALVHTIILQNFFHLMMTTGMRIRAAVIGLLYEKSLRLSSTSRKDSTAGDIVTLMSVDTQRVTELMIDINHLWLAPVHIAVAVYFLYTTMGVSIFAGFALMVLLIPVSAIVTRLSEKLQTKQMIEKGRRIRIINDVLDGIKVLKLYAWEKPFMDQIKSIRNKELKYLRTAAFLNAGFHFTFTCAPFMVSLATFAIYVLTGNNLTAAKAFVAISLFNILRIPLGLLPVVIISTVQAYISIKRITEFLVLEERNPRNVQRTSPPHDDSLAICVQDGAFSWNKEEEPQLNNINLSVRSGSLLAVVGHVGCGKSTLLSSLLGETEKLQGDVYMKGSVAYVPQQAWIQNATVRDNILFGKEFDKQKYWKVVEACALKTDLDILPAGDSTEIGERGINLSGGQKQRISLARAVYFDADVYLLDDPLSAVDAYVGKHIFDEVIGPRGLLEAKTRVLVTHGVGFLPKMNQIVVLKDGRISEVGTYSNMLAGRGAFADFLVTYGAEDKEEDVFAFEEATKTKGAKPVGCVKQNPLLRCLSEENGSTFTLDTSADHDVPAPKRAAQRRRSLTGSLSSEYSRLFSLWSFETAAECFIGLGHFEADFGKMIVEEDSKTGKINLSVIKSYIKSAGIFLTVTMLLFFTLMEGCVVGSGMWLALWSSTNVTTTAQRDRFLGVYGGIGLTQAIFVLLACMTLSLASVIASKTLHNTMLVNVMKAPMSFFETTPLGRIVSRLSKDIFIIDDLLPRTLAIFMIDLFEFFGILIIISYATPWFLAIVFPLGFLYLAIQRVFISASRQLRRIESVSRSPIYNHFFESISGVNVIRAFEQQSRFIRDNSDRVDANHVALYPSLVSLRWLGVRLSLVGNFLTFFAALLAVIGRDELDSGLVGLSMAFAVQIIARFSAIGRKGSELETHLVSLERVQEYSKTPNEAAWIEPDNRPPEDWPDKGDISFEDFDLKYREGLPLVLKNINCHIKPGQKIGIVGRTGAGKSTLTLALFRILESDGGKVVVDGIDISKIGLQDLRSKFAIIPQDPVLFSGTLRVNLDPFDEHSDQELWRVLELSHLQTFCSGLAKGLRYPIAEGGANLSVGQRQLVCLARALLRHSKLLVLDEATAAVDLETDDLIQQTIRQEFADRTVLTIAHRLNTIMDYDRILVLDKGFVAEFDSPQSLLAREGIFYSMARDAGLV